MHDEGYRHRSYEGSVLYRSNTFVLTLIPFTLHEFIHNSNNFCHKCKEALNNLDKAFRSR